MNSFLLYFLFFAYELYYTSNHIGPSGPFLALKLFALFVCAAYASLGLNKDIARCSNVDLYLLFFYLVLIFSSSIFSVSPIYVCVYGLIFVALLIFTTHIGAFIVENSAYELVKYLILMFTILITISLLGYIVSIKSFFYHDVWGNLRVQGVYGEPSRLAQVSAVNILLSLFYIRKRLIKATIIGMSFWGLVLAGNRSYMVGIVIIFYLVFLTKLKVRKWGFIAISFLFLVFVVSSAYLIPRVAPQGLRDYLRLESITSLSGRLDVWSKALPLAIEKPLGTGFQLGGSVLVEVDNGRNTLYKNANNFSLLGKTSGDKTTLHNGYIQALCNLGPIGFIVYLIIFLRGLFFVYKNWEYDHMRPFASIIVFFAIVNFSATILVGPTTSNSLLFWTCWFVLMFNWQKKKNEFNVPTAKVKAY